MLLRKATYTALFLLCIAVTPARAAISFIAGYTAQTTNVTISAPNANDIILVCASGTSLPSLASGYTSLLSIPGTNSSLPFLCGWKLSDGTETNSGTWTSGTDVEVAVYRGANTSTPFGPNTTSSDVASNANITYKAITLSVGDGTSWIVVYGRAQTSSILAVPSPLVVRANRSTGTRMIADGNSGLSSWADHTENIGAQASATGTFELLVSGGAVTPHPGPHVH